MYLSKQTEIAISLLSMFFGGEITYIEDQLDVLAAACDLYMQQHPAHSFGPTANASALERAKHMALAICDFLADQGFYGARHDLFHDVDNNLLHKCFTTNRQTLPLSLTVIFCGIANRLGMAASLCNFPGCIIAVVMVDPSASIPAPNETLSTAPQEMFWVVVSDYLTKANEAYQPTPSDAFARSERRPHPSDLFLDRAELAQIIRRRGLPPSDEYWRPTRPDAMVRRAVNNVLQSVQNLPAELRDHATRVARDTVRRMEVDRQSRHLRAQWSNLTRVDHAFLSAYHGRTDPVEREKILSRVAKVWDDDTTCAATCIDEDEATWGIVKSWRAESMHTLALMPTEQVMPAMPFRQQLRDYLEARASDNDWTHTIKNLDRRVAEPSDHMEQMAKYAAVNVLMRFGGLSPARNSDLIAGFVQKDFPLDLEVMETDLLGVEHADAEEGAEVGADATSEGSDSSNEATFSSREESYGALPLGGGVLGDSFSPASRMAMARMLQAARMSDRQGQPIRRRRAAETRQEPGQTESPGNASGIREAEDVGTGTAAFRIGTVFRHRTYGYTGHIATWDPHCAAPEDWIVHMGVDRLPAPFEPAAYDSSASSSTPRRGGRHQPFYESITYTSHHGSRRYVAEVNIEPIRGPIWIYGLPPNEARTSLDADGSEEESLALKGALHRVMQDRLFGASFRCFDQARGRFRRSMLTREMFPDDLSDDEDDEEGDGELGALEAESMENLSEDGHW
ncbi:hypothetical protein EX895_001721 [Sporisorium graminicola]|uniref:Hemimethylated DNA-binding domain-containing protein n=1 Tax=Sporisorium graminicola TaxID=280036 RepID=A0A4U7KXB1_9BASI|nr:hypothetical protein EX895_001721 [Sporisorium graminicola]TKY89190.1 hypothetical protein EX895_001721 [Sporisorium graminicola]